VSDERIREFMHSQPFKPFDIRVSDGRVYTVDHPDFVSRSRGGSFITYTTEDNRIVVIDLAHVTSLEVANTRAA
jgi:hypothetical protein